MQTLINTARMIQQQQPCDAYRAAAMSMQRHGVAFNERTMYAIADALGV